MFSLIISIIAIALVAALAAASVYYGAKSYARANAEARVAQVLNEAEQISGALTAYKVEKGEIAIQQPCADDNDANTTSDYDGCLKTLIDDGYLTTIIRGPDGFAWRVNTTDNTLVRSGLTSTECSLANFMAGVEASETTPAPTCTDVEDNNTAHVCCEA